MAKTRILVADDTDIMLNGVTTILSGIKSFEVIATATSATTLCDLVRKHHPELVFMSDALIDLSLEETMDKITQINPDCSVIVLSSSSKMDDINRALKAGVSGYLLKSVSKKELQHSAQKAVKGDDVFSDSILKLLSKSYISLSREEASQGPTNQITKREQEVLELIVEGYTSQEIAKKLYISPRTVETHRANLLQKLKINNTAGLVRYAIQKGYYRKRST